MVAKQGTALRPLRLARPGDRSGNRHAVPPVPERVPEHALAPDWNSPTEGNGSATPRGELLVALLAPDAATAAIWRQRARVVTPPLWKGGKVTLHVIVSESTGDPQILLAMVDLGLIDSTDAGLIGYPSGVET